MPVIRFVAGRALATLVVVGLAALMAPLPWSGGPTAFADPFSSSFDVQLLENTVTSSGNGNGTVEPGESPDVITTLKVDPPPSSGDQAFPDLTSIVFDGLTPAYGVAITDGAVVGMMDFSIKSNVNALAQNNFDPSTGQPFVCGAGATLSASSVDLFDADLGTGTDADVDGAGPLGSGVISEEGTQEDNFGADGSAGGNGLADGIDLLPDPLANYLIPSLALGSPIARSFGVATLIGAYHVKIDVNLLLYDLGGGEYLLISVLGYPGIPTEPPSASNVLNQTVIICPPFSSTVTLFGVVEDNPGTVPQRTAVAGDHKYEVLLSSGDNYDGDEAAAPYDTCPATVSIDTDLAGHPDTDSDRWDSACDPITAAGQSCTGGGTSSSGADNDCSGAVETFGIVPASFTGDQDVDGDTTLNTVDNCPFAADVDLDNADGDENPATGIDYQLDSDGDTVGDLCDPAPIVKGDGTGYETTKHPHGFPGQPDGYHDHDQIWNDAFSVPGSEVEGGAVLENTVDSGNDGDPDFVDEIANSVYDVGEPVDSDGDADRDGHSDGCEAVRGSDPLDPASVPVGPPPFGDCDGDGTPDWDEEALGTDPFTFNCTDRDGDSLCDTTGNDKDDDGCSAADEALLGPNFSDITWYDVFDVKTPVKSDGAGANKKRNGVVDIADALAVLFYFGANQGAGANGNGVDYDTVKGVDLDGDSTNDVTLNPNVPEGLIYDRTPGPGLTAGPPNGFIDIADALVNLKQFGMMAAVGGGCSAP